LAPSNNCPRESLEVPLRNSTNVVDGNKDPDKIKKIPIARLKEDLNIGRPLFSPGKIEVKLSEYT
jgi:hypothetical protein